MKEFEDITTSLKAAQDRLTEEAKEAMKTGLASLFARFPVIGSIQWTQYVPVFNDGEPCVFTVGEVEFHPDGGDGGEDSQLSYYQEYVKNEATGHYDPTNNYRDPRMTPALEAAMRSVERFFSYNKKMLESSFGAGTKVVVTKDKVVTEEYDCGY